MNEKRISYQGKLRVIGARKADESLMISMARLPKIHIMKDISRVADDIFNFTFLELLSVYLIRVAY